MALINMAQLLMLLVQKRFKENVHAASNYDPDSYTDFCRLTSGPAAPFDEWSASAGHVQY
jgi:hypothetical protein